MALKESNKKPVTETKQSGGKLSHEEFTKKAIVALRKEGYKGIHCKYSGFNEAFRKYFPNDDVAEITNKLAKSNKIDLRPVKGGVMLYLSGDMPSVDNSKRAEETLEKIIG